MPRRFNFWAGRRPSVVVSIFAAALLAAGVWFLIWGPDGDEIPDVPVEPNVERAAPSDPGTPNADRN